MNKVDIKLIKKSKVWDQDFEDWDEILDKGILKCEHIPEESKAMLSVVRTGQIIENIIEKMLSKHNISIAQKSVLESLYFSPALKMSQSELSKYIFSSKANVSTLLNRMEEKGLIKRETISKRENHISITPEGKKLLEQVFSEFSCQKTQLLRNDKEAKKITKTLLELRTKIKGEGIVK